MNINLPYQDKPSRWSSHSVIATRLRILPPQSKILDIGTASGVLARMCQDCSFRFYGVEPNSQWAEIAASLYDELWVGYIDDVETKFLTGYDVVVLGDILEHLHVPDEILKKLIALQSSGCTFLISVPNVANLWVRLNLLMGRFEYVDRGILDRTHLRFFTLKTLKHMLDNVGLKTVSIQVTPIPLELISSFFLSPPGMRIHAVFARLTTLFPTLLGYQFVVEANKP